VCDVLAGDSNKGVFLCKHADVQLKAAALKGQQNCWLFLFLVSFFLLLTHIFLQHTHTHRAIMSGYTALMRNKFVGSRQCNFHYEN